MHSDSAAWNESVPSGNEAIRIVKVMRYLSLIMFNFQKFLNLNGAKISASKILYETIEFHFEFIGKNPKVFFFRNCFLLNLKLNLKKFIDSSLFSMISKCRSMINFQAANKQRHQAKQWKKARKKSTQRNKSMRTCTSRSLRMRTETTRKLIWHKLRWMT